MDPYDRMPASRARVPGIFVIFGQHIAAYDAENFFFLQVAVIRVFDFFKMDDTAACSEIYEVVDFVFFPVGILVHFSRAVLDKKDKAFPFF